MQRREEHFPMALGQTCSMSRILRFDAGRISVFE